MAEKDAATVLEEAADLLLVNGRNHGTGRDPSGSFCVLGALAQVVEPGWWMVDEFGHHAYWGVCRKGEAREAVVALAGRLPRSSVWPEHTVSDWNDATGDDDEVRDTLLLVAKDLRAAAVPS